MHLDLTCADLTSMWPLLTWYVLTWTAPTWPLLSWSGLPWHVLSRPVLTWPVMTLPVLTWSFLNWAVISWPAWFDLSWLDLIYHDLPLRHHLDTPTNLLTPSRHTPDTAYTLFTLQTPSSYPPDILQTPRYPLDTWQTLTEQPSNFKHEKLFLLVESTGCPKKNAPLWFLLNFSGWKHTRRLEHISF